MEKETLRNAIYELWGYFQRRVPPSEKVIDRWWQKISFIPDNYVSKIVDETENLDNIPRNIPKLFKSIYGGMLRHNPNKSKIEYDAYDDIRYPVGKLYQATGIYIDKGRDEFTGYCRENRMPSQDVERCENKVRCLFDRGVVKEALNGIGIDISDNDEKENTEQSRSENSRTQKEIWADYH